MSRTEIANRFSPRETWFKLLREAWGKLTESGQKKKVYEAAGIVKGTAYRIINGDTAAISNDTIEKLRLAINDELRAMDKLPPLEDADDVEQPVPPAIVLVRSKSHYVATLAAEEADKAEMLDTLVEWMDFGRKLAIAGTLPVVLDILQSRVTLAVSLDEALSQSSEVISGSLPSLVRDRSDAAGTKGDGRRRHEETGRVDLARPPTARRKPR